MDRYFLANIKKLSLATLFLCSCLDAIEYKLGGRAEGFGKFSFNEGGANRASGKYPTGSYATMVGALDGSLKINDKFSMTLSGQIGGIVNDSTIRIGDENGNYISREGMGYNYIGFYGSSSYSTRKYIVYNSNATYSDGFVSIKAGRYEAVSTDWFGTYNQGAEIFLDFGVVRPWVFYSHSKALVDSQWMVDFWKVNGNKGIFAGGVDFRLGGFEFAPYVYYGEDRFSAPGFRASYDSGESESSDMRSRLTFYGLFMNNNRSVRNELSPYDWGEYGRGGQALLIKYRQDVKSIFFQLSLYKNFGNAIGHLGVIGSPMDVDMDMFDAGVYDIGPSLNDVHGKNALTGYFIVGQDSIGKFSWKLLGRSTKSDRSDEVSFVLTLFYDINENFRVGTKLNYFNDITKAGYNLFGTTLAENRSDDRSNIMTFVRQTF